MIYIFLVMSLAVVKMEHILGAAARIFHIQPATSSCCHMGQEEESSSEASHSREKKMGFVYADPFATPHQMQSYSNPIPHDLLQTGIETLGLQEQQQHQIDSRDLMRSPIDLWRGGLLGKPEISSIHGGRSSTTTASSSYYTAADFTGGESSPQENLLAVARDVIDWPQQGAGTPLLVDDSSLRCLLPGDGAGNVHNGTIGIGFSRGGLSLSLSNAMSQQQIMNQHGMGINQNPDPQHWHLMRDEGLVEEGSRFYQLQQQLRSSCRYLGPAQELLTEFCNLGGGQKHYKTTQRRKSNQQEEDAGGGSSLLSLDMLELQRRRARLLTMLEEVERRYRRYCEQMRSVVASFEAVAGVGGAAGYTMLAWKAMSRHFRCLRDGVVGQIKATRKAMEEKSPGTSTAPGATRGETPRLKILDQCIRQQKAFQQGGGMMDNHQPWRPQRGLPERSVSVLRAWLFEHFLHPYPSDVDKHILSRQTGLSRSQVSNWFINARVRLWKPMVEEMYLEETKEKEEQQQQEHDSSDATTTMASSEDYFNTTQCPNPSNPMIIKSTSSSKSLNHQDQFARPFDVVSDIDFSYYNSSNSVSLTLGLQQHVDGGRAGVGGVSLAFPPGDHHENSMFISSIMDGDVQVLPHRNLMGAQLLHDLAE